MGGHGITLDSRGGAYVDAVGLARGSSDVMSPWPDQEALEAKYWVANEALLWRSLAPMFVQDSAAFVEPRRQYHNI